MRGLFILIAIAIPLGLAAPAAAQVASPAPDRVAVTVYRAPNRSADEKIDPEWLQGYALVTETRTVTIPVGRAVIRFEGVAGGILPESAIIAGLPDGVREKNLDADLLSPYSLYTRSYGRPVTLRRTIGGKTVEERAIIRSGPDGAAILQTKDGFVAADCRKPGTDELVYDKVPEGLSAKPTLSVETESSRAGRVTLTLSYLAWGFDWQANYVATMRPDGKTADLFAWVTLANGDVTSFADAETMVVAGRLNRTDEREDSDTGTDAFEFQCFSRPPPPPLPPPPPPSPSPMASNMMMEMRAGVADKDIVVTGARRVRQEELGDIKLYRVPDRTTVAALSQKQVALLDKPAVPVDIVYRTHVNDDDVSDVRMLLRAQNRKEQGLGLPLPAGPVAVFEPLGERKLLVGEGSIGDKAINEEVEVEIADATQVTAQIDDGDRGKGWGEHVLTVTNANPFAVRFEAEIDTSDGYRRTSASTKLSRSKSGHDLWAVQVPANGTATLRYRLTTVGSN